MSTKPLPTDLPILPFSSAHDMRLYLSQNHSTSPGFHLKLAKKGCKAPSVTASEAVETALCFGWIDGQANPFDTDYWLVRYTPRRAKSIWSKKNVDTVARLLEEGQMQPAGLEAVKAAKRDGRWGRAYAGPATIEVPEDFKVALMGDKAAETFFERLNKSQRYSVLWRVETSTPKGRAKKIESLVAMLTRGEMPGGMSKTKVKVGKGMEKQGTKATTVTKTPIRKPVALERPMRDGNTTVSPRAGLRSQK